MPARWRDETRGTQSSGGPQSASIGRLAPAWTSTALGVERVTVLQPGANVDSGGSSSGSRQTAERTGVDVYGLSLHEGVVLATNRGGFKPANRTRRSTPY